MRRSICISVLICLMMVPCLGQSAFAAVGGFSDVEQNGFYADAVEWAVAQGITVGIGKTTFSPHATCTRAQAVTFLWRAAGTPAVMGDEPFTDVSSKNYYYNAVRWAVRLKITKGTSATSFSPDAPCTRAQVVTFLWRSVGAPVLGSDNPFSDIGADRYYYDAVRWANGEGITNGTSATLFSPDVSCTRGQIVTFLFRTHSPYTAAGRIGVLHPDQSVTFVGDTMAQLGALQNGECYTFGVELKNNTVITQSVSHFVLEIEGRTFLWEDLAVPCGQRVFLTLDADTMASLPPSGTYLLRCYADHTYLFTQTLILYE